MMMVILTATLAPVMSSAPPWSPRPVVPSSLERGLPRRLWEMKSDPVLRSLSIPLGTDSVSGVRDVERNKLKQISMFKPHIAPRLPENTEGGKLRVGRFSRRIHSWQRLSVDL